MSPPATSPARGARAAARACLVAATVGAAACGGGVPGLEDQTDSRAGQTGPGEIGPGAIAWQPCRRGPVGNARCARVAVPLDHELAAREGADASESIELEVAVLPALVARPAADPVVILVGGPGQAATEVGPRLDRLVDALRERRDVLLVDQRGTGNSAPLDCALTSPVGAPPEAHRPFDAELPPDRLDACLASYPHDPVHFGTEAAVRDLELVRARAGFPALNLYGASYGTRLALAYLRRYPERVRRVVLDGVAPFDMGLPVPMAADGERALELAAADCAAAPACARRFPDIVASVHALLGGLEGYDPAREVTLADPRSGARSAVRLTRDGVAGAVRGALYAPETTAVLPLAVEAALAGDFAPLAALADATGDALEGVSLGHFLTVVCSEDRVAAAGRDLDAETRGSFLGAGPTRELWAACEHWPRTPLPEDYFEPVRATAPTLIVSGQLDPATPPRWGEAVAASLADVRHVEVPGMAHGTWRHPCVAAVMADFVDREDPGGLDASCTQSIARPPFFVSLAGPDPRGGGLEGQDRPRKADGPGESGP